jgi:3-oxoacyl-[acyl-carrier-protein] synthase III
VLLIGGDTYSTVVDPRDRSTAMIFGDGAGAVTLRAGPPDEPGAVGPFDLGSDGALMDLAIIKAGGSRQRSTREPAPTADNYLRIQGRTIFQNAVLKMADSTLTVLEHVGWSVSDVDRFVAHQANARILAALANKLDIPADRVVSNIERVGNTSAASIPLALADAATSGQLQSGHRVLLTAFGGGLTWGSTVLRWPEISLHGQE